MKHLFLFAWLFFIIFSCGQKVPEIQKSQEFYVRYLQDENSVKAEATFYENQKDQKPHAVERNNVRFNGKQMKVIPHIGLTYSFSEKGGSPLTCAFTYQTGEGEEAKNQNISFKMLNLGNWHFSDTMLFRSKPQTFSWEGETMTEGETFMFFWQNAENQSTTMQVNGNINGNKIDIPAVEMSKLKAGKWEMYVVRKKSFQNNTPDGQAKCLVEFYTTSKKFKILN